MIWFSEVRGPGLAWATELQRTGMTGSPLSVPALDAVAPIGHPTGLSVPCFPSRSNIQNDSV